MDFFTIFGIDCFLTKYLILPKINFKIFQKEYNLIFVRTLLVIQALTEIFKIRVLLYSIVHIYRHIGFNKQGRYSEGRKREGGERKKYRGYIGEGEFKFVGLAI